MAEEWLGRGAVDGGRSRRGTVGGWLRLGLGFRLGDWTVDNDLFDANLWWFDLELVVLAAEERHGDGRMEWKNALRAYRKGGEERGSAQPGRDRVEFGLSAWRWMWFSWEAQGGGARI